MGPAGLDMDMDMDKLVSQVYLCILVIQCNTECHSVAHCVTVCWTVLQCVPVLQCVTQCVTVPVGTMCPPPWLIVGHECHG